MNEQMNKEDLVSNMVIKLIHLIPIKHSASNIYLLHTCVQCCVHQHCSRHWEPSSDKTDKNPWHHGACILAGGRNR